MASFLWNLIVSALVLLLAAELVLDWLRASGAPLRGALLEREPVHQGVEITAKETAKVFCSALLLRVLVFLVASFAAAIALGHWNWQELLSLWEKWDAFHYVRLVEQGYSGYTENGQHFFLVFYPFYVWLVRLVRVGIGNTLASGLLVSFFSFAGGCSFFYRLVALDYGRKNAKWSLLFLSAFPFSFFFGAMMTESLFFLTTAAGLYYIRKHRWGWAGIWGVLAAMTRMHGLLLIGAALAELIQSRRLFALRGKTLKREVGHILRQLPVILLPLLGTAAYLGLNYVVDGNAFAFTVHQQVRWSQGFMWISQVLEYLVKNLFTYPNPVVQVQMWLPEVLLFPLFFVLLWRSRREHRSMYTLYAFVTLILDYSLAWLLSAGRYLSCAIPFFLFAATKLEKRPKAAAAILSVMAVLQIVALSIYLQSGQIM